MIQNQFELMGLVVRPWSTERRGISPLFFYYFPCEDKAMTERILSVFIDESGDFGPYDPRAPYYIVAMVLHDQSIDISGNINAFEQHLSNLGYTQHAVHTGPLIRRESVYSQDLTEERKRLFNALFNFARKLDINYACAKIKKSECADKIAIASKLAKSYCLRFTKQQLIFQQL